MQKQINSYILPDEIYMNSKQTTVSPTRRTWTGDQRTVTNSPSTLPSELRSVNLSQSNFKSEANQANTTTKMIHKIPPIQIPDSITLPACNDQLASRGIDE